MSLTPPAALERLTSRLHRNIYRQSNGRRGATVGQNKRPVALLTTIGRKTGARREWPVLCLTADDASVVVASNGGRDRHPAWYLNTQANPSCELQLGPDRFPVTARDATADEARELWPRLHELHPGSATYQAKTNRELPVCSSSQRSRRSRRFRDSRIHAESPGGCASAILGIVTHVR